MVGIYKLENKINNKIYIGQSIDIDERIKSHIRSSKNENATDYNVAIHRAIRKYGIENFSITVVKQCDVSELDENEIFYINEFQSYTNGYNETIGGYGTHICGEQHHNAKLCEQDIIDIRTRYNNHERKKDVFYDYRDKIHFTGFHKIWIGETWKHIKPEVFTDENINFHKHNTGNIGEENRRTKLTNNDVLTIKQMHKNGIKSIDIYKLFDDKITYKSFMNIISNQNWHNI